MLDTLRNAWKVEEIRKKLLFTLLMIVIFRLGTAIPVPYVDRQVLNSLFQGSEDNIIGFLNMMTGGALSQLSVFAMSIYPYITASIIIQLLTVAIPKLEELSKEGESGQKKIQQYTKIGAVALGFLQALGMTQTFMANAVIASGPFQNVAVVTTMVAGTMFLVWLGEKITQNGIGNGISILIFIGIVSRLPESVISWTKATLDGLINPLISIAFLLIFLLIIVGVVLLTQGERRINVQYAKRVVGRKMYGGQATHIPIKVNMAGVMPVIFATSLLSLPNIIAGLFGEGVRNFVNLYLTPGGPVGVVVFNVVAIMLIILFAYFYTAIQFNTVEYAKNLQQYGGFIPGIRPGRPTSEYMSKISNRITFIGAISLAILYVLPTVLSAILRVRINFGGTAILIVVGVVLETIKQMESMLMMRHYKGFLNR